VKGALLLFLGLGTAACAAADPIPIAGPSLPPTQAPPPANPAGPAHSPAGNPNPAKPPAARRLVFDVREYGAKGNGVALDTTPVNRAIAECYAAGGGTVFFPAGTYRIGTVEMLSNVTLFLDAGSVLKGSGNIRDYPPIPYSSEERNTALIVAIAAHDIAITGRGTIDGNGDAFAKKGQAYDDRDYVAAYTRQGEGYHAVNDLPDDGPVAFTARPGILILLLNCQGIQVSDVRIVNAPNWCLHAACSQDVVFSRIEIRSSLLLPNSDGIDGSFCRNVRISDCNIEAGDDAIAFGPCADGYGSRTTENIVVENCTLSSRSAGIRIGWGAHTGASDFRNLVFSNIVIRDSNRGIGLFVRAGESIENVLFSNVIIETRLFRGKWWGKAEPIHISAVRARWSTGPMGRIRNVSFEGVMIEGEQGIVVSGCDDSTIEDVTFDRIRLMLKNGPLLRSFGGNFDFRPAVDGHLKIFKHDIPALFASHVKNLAVEHVDVDREESLPDFFRYGLEVENFDGLLVDGFRDRQFKPEEPNPRVAIRLSNGRNVTMSNCAAKREDRRFVAEDNVEP
jgi:polygalacturonase